MNCPKCGSDKVTVQIEQVSAKSRERKMGCLWSFGRLFLIVFTFGLWLVIGKRSRTQNTKYVNRTVAVCQNCGNKWVPSPNEVQK